MLIIISIHEGSVVLYTATQFHDNDIAYFPASLLARDELLSNSTGGEKRTRRGATSDYWKLWKNGIVYYTIASAFNGNRIYKVYLYIILTNILHG